MSAITNGSRVRQASMSRRAERESEHYRDPLNRTPTDDHGSPPDMAVRTYNTRRAMSVFHPFWTLAALRIPQWRMPLCNSAGAATPTQLRVTVRNAIVCSLRAIASTLASHPDHAAARASTSGPCRDFSCSTASNGHVARRSASRAMYSPSASPGSEEAMSCFGQSCSLAAEEASASSSAEPRPLRKWRLTSVLTPESSRVIVSEWEDR